LLSFSDDKTVKIWRTDNEQTHKVRADSDAADMTAQRKPQRNETAPSLTASKQR
jgi:hypothetical protein